MKSRSKYLENGNAETAFLEALMSSNGVYFKIDEYGIGLKPSMLADPNHGIVFDHACHLISKGDQADAITLEGGCKSDKRFKEFESDAEVDIAKTIHLNSEQTHNEVHRLKP